MTTHSDCERFPFFNPVTFIGKGWSVGEDREAIFESWNPTETVLVKSLRANETSLTGEKTIERLNDSGDKPLGARALLYFWTNQDKIPEEWKGKLVYFDATILRNPHGSRYSLCLLWYGGSWRWLCDWLDADRGANCVSACAS